MLWDYWKGWITRESFAQQFGQEYRVAAPPEGWQDRIESVKARVQKTGWPHSHGSLNVVYVNDVLDWLDELAASSSGETEP